MEIVHKVVGSIDLNRLGSLLVKALLAGSFYTDSFISVWVDMRMMGGLSHRCISVNEKSSPYLQSEQGTQHALNWYWLSSCRYF